LIVKFLKHRNLFKKLPLFFWLLFLYEYLCLELILIKIILMKKFYLLLMLITGSLAMAQTASLKVQLTDEGNQPLAYATVLLQEGNRQTVSDETGVALYEK